MKIGIFDSGIGGLNVLKKIIEKYPCNEYIYFGDTLHLPYGEKSKEQLLGYATDIITFFEEKEVSLIIIACGTCSNFKEELQRRTYIPIMDCITPTLWYLRNQYSNVALFATEATVLSRVFENKIKSMGINVKAIACKTFVPMLESGRKNEIDVTLYTKQVKNEEAIILGCTHYPLVRDMIEENLSISCIDMGECLCNFLDLSSNGNISITIYYSKIDDILLKNTESIIDYEKEIIEYVKES